jgi:hypothetical protein
VRIKVDPGGEYLLPFAKKKLAELRAQLERTDVAALNKNILVSESDSVFVQALRFGVDEIRISSGGGEPIWQVANDALFVRTEYVLSGGGIKQLTKAPSYSAAYIRKTFARLHDEGRLRTAQGFLNATLGQIRVRLPASVAGCALNAETTLSTVRDVSKLSGDFALLYFLPDTALQDQAQVDADGESFSMAGRLVAVLTLEQILGAVGDEAIQGATCYDTKPLRGPFLTTKSVTISPTESDAYIAGASSWHVGYGLEQACLHVKGIETTIVTPHPPGQTLVLTNNLTIISISAARVALAGTSLVTSSMDWGDAQRRTITWDLVLQGDGFGGPPGNPITDGVQVEQLSAYQLHANHIYRGTQRRAATLSRQEAIETITFSNGDRTIVGDLNQHPSFDVTSPQATFEDDVNVFVSDGVVQIARAGVVFALDAQPQTIAIAGIGSVAERESTEVVTIYEPGVPMTITLQFESLEKFFPLSTGPNLQNGKFEGFFVVGKLASFIRPGQPNKVLIVEIASNATRAAAFQLQDILRGLQTTNQSEIREEFDVFLASVPALISADPSNAAVQNFVALVTSLASSISAAIAQGDRESALGIVKDTIIPSTIRVLFDDFGRKDLLNLLRTFGTHLMVL